MRLISKLDRYLENKNYEIILKNNYDLVICFGEAPLFKDTIKIDFSEIIFIPTNYLVDKVDNIVTGVAQDVKDIVKGNLFYDDLGMGSSTIETMKEGNLLGTIEGVVNELKDNKEEETVSGWKKNLFK